jgi:hypothetical protein
VTLKVVVELNEAFQDLQGHLQELPSQIRSERLRTLALTGLHIEQGRMSAFVSRAPGPHLGEIKEYARVVVILNEAYPELLGVFTGISPRYRAARLRSLASIGLNALAASAVHAGGWWAFQCRYRHPLRLPGDCAGILGFHYRIRPPSCARSPASVYCRGGSSSSDSA